MKDTDYTKMTIEEIAIRFIEPFTHNADTVLANLRQRTLSQWDESWAIVKAHMRETGKTPEEMLEQYKTDYNEKLKGFPQDIGGAISAISYKIALEKLEEEISALQNARNDLEEISQKLQKPTRSVTFKRRP